MYISFKQYFKKLLKKRLNFNDFKRIRLLKSKNIFPNKTDLIIWDKRLFHSPWATKLRLNYNFNLSPKIEKHLHKSLIEPPCFPRSLLGFDFGKDCKELNNYLHNWISLRDDYYEYWKFKSEKYFNKININKSEIYLNDCCINPCNKNFSRNAKKNQSELLN